MSQDPGTAGAGGGSRTRARPGGGGSQDPTAGTGGGASQDPSADGGSSQDPTNGSSQDPTLPQFPDISQLPDISNSSDLQALIRQILQQMGIDPSVLGPITRPDPHHRAGPTAGQDIAGATTGGGK